MAVFNGFLYVYQSVSPCRNLSPPASPAKWLSDCLRSQAPEQHLGEAQIMWLTFGFLGNITVVSGMNRNWGASSCMFEKDIYLLFVFGSVKKEKT